MCAHATVPGQYVPQASRHVGESCIGNFIRTKQRTRSYWEGSLDAFGNGGKDCMDRHVVCGRKQLGTS